MKFLLVALNTKYIHSNPALYSLRAYAGEELKQHIEIAEYTINHRFTEILANLYKKKPDVLGFSCYIWNIDMVTELAAELKKLFPEVPIWLGGPEASQNAQTLLKYHPYLTGVMVGEGEVTFRELLEWYVQREESGKQLLCPESELGSIKGLCLTSGFTQGRELTDITAIPFLYENLEEFENKIIYYESSRGCPFRCSYCLSSIDKKVRFRELSVVERELQFFLDHKVKQVKFVDRTFNCNHEHCTRIWRYISEHDNGVTNFHFEIAADLLNEEELMLLEKMRPGLVQLEIGVQTANPRTLEAICRKMDLNKLEAVAARINKGKNVHQHLDLIAGLPYEDLESFERSFHRVFSMKPQQLQLGFLKVLKGSQMEEQAEEFGICYTDRPPYEVLYTRWLSFEDVLLLKRVEEMVELYYNSNQFRFTLGYLQKKFESPFRMFLSLANFYERRGYFVPSPARSYRYTVLFEFVCETDGEREALYRELLTYDMYLRENLKSRPEFIGDGKEYKERIRDFYRSEEENRRFLPDYEDYDSKQMAKMTHMEPFFYPVWKEDLGETETKTPEPAFVLFDYRRRCALTEDAGTVVLQYAVEGWSETSTEK